MLIPHASVPQASHMHHNHYFQVVPRLLASSGQVQTGRGASSSHWMMQLPISRTRHRHVIVSVTTVIHVLFYHGVVLLKMKHGRVVVHYGHVAVLCMVCECGRCNCGSGGTAMCVQMLEVHNLFLWVHQRGHDRMHTPSLHIRTTAAKSRASWTLNPKPQNS